MLARVISASPARGGSPQGPCGGWTCSGVCPVSISPGCPMPRSGESQIRVKSAIINSGFQFPYRKVVLNMAPADLRKEGSALDLPIALGILSANEVVAPAPPGHPAHRG